MTTTSMLLDGTVLETFRAQAGVSQAQMAGMMGLPVRTYEDIIALKSTLRPVHMQAAEMALLQIAVRKEDPNILTPALRSLVLDLAKVIANEKPAG